MDPTEAVPVGGRKVKKAFTVPEKKKEGLISTADYAKEEKPKSRGGSKKPSETVATSDEPPKKGKKTNNSASAKENEVIASDFNKKSVPEKSEKKQAVEIHKPHSPPKNQPIQEVNDKKRGQKGFKQLTASSVKDSTEQMKLVQHVPEPKPIVEEQALQPLVQQVDPENERDDVEIIAPTEKAGKKKFVPPPTLEKKINELSKDKKTLAAPNTSAPSTNIIASKKITAMDVEKPLQKQNKKKNAPPKKIKRVEVEEEMAASGNSGESDNESGKLDLASDTESVAEDGTQKSQSSSSKRHKLPISLNLRKNRKEAMHKYNFRKNIGEKKSFSLKMMDAEGEETSEMDKRKASESMKVKPCICFSGFTAEDKAILANICKRLKGTVEEQDMSKFTVLVVKDNTRTKKILFALIRGIIYLQRLLYRSLRFHL